jgi:hypothetical protein
MAKKKISGLPAGSALNGTELVPIVQAGTTKRTTAQDIANLGNASGVEGSGTINRLAKFTASSTIGNSAFFDDGTNQGTETTTAVNRFIMSANASIAKIFSFRSANLPRWAFRVDGTESGANAGADLAIRRYNDAGTFIDAPLFFQRSTGFLGLGTNEPGSILEIKEINRANGSNITNVQIFSTSAQNTGVGGTIGFGGLFTGSDYAPFGSIRGGKENNTSGNYAGYLALQTIQNGGSLVERMRIASGGNVLIGTTTDSGYKLDVFGTARVSGNLDVTGTIITLSTASSLGARMSFASSSTNGRTYQIGSNFITGNGEFSIFDATSGVERLSISATGVATFTNAIAIGNTVASGVAVASTHKVTIVIGGVTYYLLASNV